MRPEIESLLTELEDPENTHLLSKLDEIALPHEAAEIERRLDQIAERLRAEAHRQEDEANLLISGADDISAYIADCLPEIADNGPAKTISLPEIGNNKTAQIIPLLRKP